MNDLKYIQETYKVPAVRGALVRYDSSSGPMTLRIRSAKNGRLLCSPKDADPKDKRRMIMHPTWQLAYLPNNPVSNAVSEAERQNGQSHGVAL